ISDRPGDVSQVAEGPLAGRSLSQLMEDDREGLLGAVAASASDRFPLLIKILDARQALSVQVHPPAERAIELGGEPKTELWYFTEADPDNVIYAGLRCGTTRQECQRRLTDGAVADCLHHLAVQSGDALFLPSGRVHALGAGVVLFEIQQN